jgi:hypothetical protein
MYVPVRVRLRHGGGLDGSEDAHQVAAEQLVEASRGVAAAQERGGDPGQVGGGASK